MLLKKQTVWLLTMLSLVIVLSVYYVTTPPKKENNMATTVQKNDEASKDAKTNTVAKKEAEDKSVVKQYMAGDETFDTIRMDIQDQRSKQIDELNTKLSDTELSAEERNDAKNAIDTLNTRSEKEEMLQGVIEGIGGTKAALVRTDNDNNVQVTIKTAKHSKTTANDIIRLVSSELPSAKDISVEVQKAN
ncbi:SpoIIIAH-like family protein [Bacillus sp. 1P06AnD]|uniref:SpoIIIAH-like family protein n=1 Tax=Bacillus sp. 1P06AnD TaxID=3132208 RepID=UPI0039A216A0